MSMLQSILQLVAQRELRAEIVFAPPIPSTNRKRRDLAREAERVIATALSLEVVHKKPGIRVDRPVAPQSESHPTGIRCPEPAIVPPAADPALTSARK